MYEEFANKTRSQKFILAHVASRQQHKIFTLHAGSVYKKTVGYFVTNVTENGVNLVSNTSPTLNAGEFYFDIQSGILYIRTSDSSDPKTKSIFTTYRHFYSNIPYNLPYDLNTGVEVHYDGLIADIGDLKLELDYENTGIALETDSNITLQNTHGHFDDIFDTHIWENQSAIFYSWSPTIAPNEARVIYKGLIKDKSFTDRSVKFNLRDQLSELKQVIDFPKFSSLDGELDDTVIDKPKRMIFGRVQQIQTVGIDKTLGGFELQGTIAGDADRNLLTGTVSGTIGLTALNGSGTLFLSEVNNGDQIKIIDGINEYTYTVQTVNSNTSITLTSTITTSFSNAEARNLEVLNNIISGTGTDFINEVSQNDKIVVTVSGIEYEFTVETVNSATELVLSDEIEVSFSGLTGYNLPEIPYRKKNRSWHVAGHKLHEFNCLITSMINFNTFEVDDVGDIEQDDFISIEGQTYIVSLVSGLKITVNQGLEPAVGVGDTVTKVPVRRVFFGTQAFVVDRDFTVTNTTECIIELDDLAEFNVARTQSPSISFQFTNSTNTVQSLSTDVDLTTVFRPRDWIRSRRIDTPTWYEILSVTVDEIKLRTTYTGPTFTGSLQKKRPEYVSDDALITCDCLGLNDGTNWIRTPAQAVKWILNEVGITNIDAASFTDSEAKCEFELSLFYPDSIGSNLPNMRDMITDINKSCFGSLYLNNDFEFTYNILNADKPEDLETIKDDDILNFSIASRNNIVNKVLLSYRPFTDLTQGQSTSKIIDLDSAFVNEAMGV